MVTLEQFRYCPTHSTHPPFCYDFHYVKPGMVAIFGDNGSGKSTLAQLMAGWYPDFLPGEITGTGTLLGTPIGRLPLNEQSATIQLVQQSPYLQLSGCTFSVEEEVAFGPENLCLAEKEIMARIDAALALTECQPLRHRHPATLSGGETQRVVIACIAGKTGVTKVINETAMNADVTSTFTQSSVNVEGAEGYTAVAYNVWVFEPAVPYENAATLKVTLG